MLKKKDAGWPNGPRRPSLSLNCLNSPWVGLPANPQILERGWKTPYEARRIAEHRLRSCGRAALAAGAELPDDPDERGLAVLPVLPSLPPALVYPPPRTTRPAERPGCYSRVGRRQ